ncbi:molybdopterin-containing oxidoreductase family protein [Nocardioides acrostichi]|uniref:Molybdopterin-dependent oxidoreductase n=1 Tax=Nocardioides acrostichi TaxID=2784339 RepID=A0A930V024_9ACTN|nr:molybdopterin-dependent oxidoreductase [Nocardioides acrostichi]MBF4163196.1 molybdopterin-dependent oxidoreductase [Nocardioides acrostichi]
MATNPSVREVTTYCRICEPLCGMIATVENGRLTSLRPDGDHPLSRGYACPKGLAFPEIQYDPERVLHPLRRVAGGAPGEFEQVSWDDALDDIATRLRATIDEHGGGAVGQYFGNPAGFNITAAIWSGAFVSSLGTSHQYTVGSQDINSRYVASKLLYGTLAQLPFPDLAETDFLLMIGANPLVSRGSGVRVPRAKERLADIVSRGGRVICVDPRRSETAKAFEHVSVNPDTDALLLASMIDVLRAEDLLDRDAVERQAVGVEELLAACSDFSPEATAARTGVSPDDVRSLARDLAAAPRAAVYGRTGSCLGRHATLISVLIDALTLLTGNLDRPGGTLLSTPVIPFEEVAERAGQMTYDASRSRIGGFPDVMGTWPSAIMAEEITTPGPDQLRVLFTLAGNPVLSGPDGAGLEAALGQLDLHVAFDLYVNETNKHADYVLPARTWLERADVPFAVVNSSPWPHVQHADAVLEPEGEARLEWEVYDEIARRAGLTLFLPGPVATLTRPVRALARRLGVRGPTPWTLVDLLMRTGPYGDRFGLRRDGVSLKRLRREPRGVMLPRPEGGRLAEVVRHDHGKVDLAPVQLVEEWEKLRAGRDAEPDPAFPLRMIGLREMRSQNSWMHNSSALMRGRQRVHTARIHPDDAEAVGLVEGAKVRISAARGSIDTVARLTDEVRPGTIAVPHGWGHDAGWTRANGAGGANSNLLASADLDDVEFLAGMTLLNGIPVAIEAL